MTTTTYETEEDIGTKSQRKRNVTKKLIFIDTVCFDFSIHTCDHTE